MTRNKVRRFLKMGIKKVIFFLALAIIFVFAIGNIIMFLWNTILPEAIGANEITFWKAIGLFILTRILFGGFKSGGRGHRHYRRKKAEWKEKWMNMSEEERVEFKQKWKDGRRKDWKEKKSNFFDEE